MRKFITLMITSLLCFPLMALQTDEELVTKVVDITVSRAETSVRKLEAASFTVKKCAAAKTLESMQKHAILAVREMDNVRELVDGLVDASQGSMKLTSKFECYTAHEWASESEDFFSEALSFLEDIVLVLKRIETAEDVDEVHSLVNEVNESTTSGIQSLKDGLAFMLVAKDAVPLCGAEEKEGEED